MAEERGRRLFGSPMKATLLLAILLISIPFGRSSVIDLNKLMAKYSMDMDDGLWSNCTAHNPVEEMAVKRRRVEKEDIFSWLTFLSLSGDSEGWANCGSDYVYSEDDYE